MTLSLATGVMLFFAAVAGGAINSVAGGGSFVAFPALLFAGVAPVPANATNTIALWPGSLASVLAYRRELGDVKRELLPLAVAALLGGLAGSLLLLRTSESTFVLLIPWLLLFATILFTFGGAVARKLTKGARAPLGVAVVAQLAISVYGGYFGGGMGIMMLAVLTLLGMTHIHRMNALKNVLGALINGVAVVAFVIAGAVRWGPGVVMIAGGITGGYAGAAIARRISPKYVRWVVMAIAWGMTAYFFVRTYRAH
ncbi:MAG TPA: sulfite exporter TauE/SafE family protein [Polyangiaceae bacterium]|nr:sulfite exporter TauE/SafE family protein [Polyangiaceae bacterium]